ncbi:MAG: 1,6-anhydro-N-acetylmuramyl-L-alanine amidase AmpD [Gammaproteobacteria bacterium]
MLELDENGDWIRDARCMPSPNCDARPEHAEIDLLVIHGISLPPGQFGGSYIDQLFTNSLDENEHEYFREIRGLRVSAHVLIDRQGRLTQYVPFSRRAWHAGASCFGDRAGCNDFSIGIELEGCDDEPYEPIQYECLAAVVSALREHWPGISRDRIVGHCHIAPERKTDPGPAFDWDLFFRILG